MPVIGWLHTGSPARYAHIIRAFQQGLKQAGYIESQNVAIEYRWADGNFDRLPLIATDLVRGHEVRVLAAVGGDPAALAAKAATTTIPIVFVGGLDPVKLGLVSSLNRPGANITGIVLLSSPLLAKQLQLLGELVPAARTIALLVNPNNSNTEQRLEEMREAARVVDRELLVVTASGELDFELAFATIRQRAGREVVPGLRRLAVMVNVSNPASVLEMGDVQAAARTFGFEVATSEIRRVEDIATALDRLKGRADALYVCADPLVNANRVRINTLALGVRLPTMHSYRELSKREV
jgi:ABC-type uncharacterized transport system substrate-binding protein